MHNTEYLYQIGQMVFLINPDKDTLLYGEIEQVTLEGYLNASNVLTIDKSYVVHMLNGSKVDEALVYPENWIFATLQEAADALEPHVED